MNWSPLALHSNYSLMKGLNDPKDLVKACVENGYKAAALTDHNSLAGCVDFYEACIANDIKPILGCHFDLKSGDNIILLAKNKNGWQSLCELVSISNTDDYLEDKPYITEDLLNHHHQNLICISYTKNKILEKIFADDYYLHDVNIDTQCIYYINKEDAQLQRILLCSSINRTLSDIESDLQQNKEIPYYHFFKFDDYYLPKNGERNKFGEYTQQIVDKCQEYNILSKPLLPHFDVPEGSTEFEYLTELCRQGWREKLSFNNAETKQIYTDRIKEELSIIEEAGLSGYFLIVQDIVNYCRKNKWLVGIGRGCFLPDSLVKMGDNTYKPISMISIGEEVIDAYGNKQKVYNTLEYDVDEELVELEFENGKIIRCTKDHEILTTNRGWVQAGDLTEEDNIVEV